MECFIALHEFLCAMGWLEVAGKEGDTAAEVAGQAAEVPRVPRMGLLG